MTGSARLAVNGDRIMSRIGKLAEFTEPDRPYTRRAFSDEYVRARDWLGAEFRAAGLEVSVDAGANLVGSRAGRSGQDRTIMLGSHIDTVPGGGRFDGIAGVVTALEVAQVLHENGVELAHRLSIVDFLSEEPSDFGAACIGSRALVGNLSSAMLDQQDQNGERLAAAIGRMGGDPLRLAWPLLTPGQVRAYLELHIEQGPVLEASGQPLGLVEGIVGIGRCKITVRGQAGHAGTTPMSMRADALVGAARFVDLAATAAGDLATQLPFVATVGQLNVLPNGSNVVPGRVDLVLEARSLDDGVTREFLEQITSAGRQVCQELGLGFDATPESFAPAVKCDAGLRAMLAEACDARGHAYGELISGAGHDAMELAAIAPTALVFVPCDDGLSHHPEENARQAELVAGTEVMLDTVIQLDRSE